MSARSSFLLVNSQVDAPKEGKSFKTIGQRLQCTSCDFSTRGRPKRMAQHVSQIHKNKYFYCTYFSCREKYFKVRIFYPKCESHIKLMFRLLIDFSNICKKNMGKVIRLKISSKLCESRKKRWTSRNSAFALSRQEISKSIQENSKSKLDFCMNLESSIFSSLLLYVLF